MLERYVQFALLLTAACSAPANAIAAELTSLRVVGAGEPGVQAQSDDAGQRSGRARVILFDGLDLQGASIPLHDDVVNLGQLGFNDRARSMLIEAGTWQFCVDAHFGGRCRVYGPGQYRSVDRVLYRALSSARVLPNEPERRRDRRREGVDLFNATDFRGERVRVQASTENLEQLNFNDAAGSLIVYRGRWEFCQHADFGGQCLTYGPGRYDRLGSLSHQISSLRRVR